MATLSATVAATSYQANNTTCDLYEHKDSARIFLPAFYSVIFIVGILGNGLALTVIIKNRKKMNSTTIYSANLVVSDILFTTALPTRIAYYGLGFHWPFGEALCKLTALVFYINIYAAVNFMTCLSFDRFLAVVHPLRTKIRRVKCATYICVLVWFLVLGQTLPLLMNMMSHDEGSKITCMEYPNFENMIDNLPWILLGACLLGYIIPLGITLICYSKISYKLCKTAKGNSIAEKSGTNKKAINTIIFIIVVFVICLTPYHLAIIIHMIKKLVLPIIPCSQQQLFQKTLHYTVFLMNLNCCFDPFIYFFACRGYKRTIMKILRRQGSVSVSSAVKTAADESSRDIGDTQLSPLSTCGSWKPPKEHLGTNAA
ncbi:G-protein coupled receptor 183 [Anolis carolinensis]|uniref:G-protein coupled receptors family 1 profile domain-containing protein n=1 Tax=Anolis carolinensis TaxID=28377 RepID=G1KUP3_ANOCA|nr:PREDICTED: G-protein coupled receptor 183 [Anolis carolinensis]XP_008105163.1 PREDICTED: G-protein coupled receptor 183 [Anolis carolinensis]|eukprot:XP_003218757.1 PREDICTED: G-protein coupled receptor 183 [Anolis carolinensis]